MIANFLAAVYVLFICFAGAILLQLLHYTNNYFDDLIEEATTCKSPFKIKNIHGNKVSRLPEDNNDRRENKKQ